MILDSIERALFPGKFKHLYGISSCVFRFFITTKKIIEQLRCSQDWLKSLVQQVWTLKEKRAKCCSNCSYCKNALALNINRLFIAGDYIFLFRWRGIFTVFLHFHSWQLEPNESIGVAIRLKQTPVHTKLKRSCFEWCKTSGTTCCCLQN